MPQADHPTTLGEIAARISEYLVLPDDLRYLRVALQGAKGVYQLDMETKQGVYLEALDPYYSFQDLWDMTDEEHALHGPICEQMKKGPMIWTSLVVAFTAVEVLVNTSWYLDVRMSISD